ncbi:Transcription factor WEREWOLF [Entamoeba marina]
MAKDTSSFVLDSSSLESFPPKRTRKRGIPWSTVEDTKLFEAVKLYGKSDWVQISFWVGSRSRKQCRERFINFVSPTAQKKPWTKYEDQTILMLYKKYGPKWSLIKTQIPERTTRAIRNRYQRIQTTTTPNILSPFVNSSSLYIVIKGGNLW